MFTQIRHLKTVYEQNRTIFISQCGNPGNGTIINWIFPLGQTNNTCVSDNPTDPIFRDYTKVCIAFFGQALLKSDPCVTTITQVKNKSLPTYLPTYPICFPTKIIVETEVFFPLALHSHLPVVIFSTHKSGPGWLNELGSWITQQLMQA